MEGRGVGNPGSENNEKQGRMDGWRSEAEDT